MSEVALRTVNTVLDTNVVIDAIGGLASTDVRQRELASRALGALARPGTLNGRGVVLRPVLCAVVQDEIVLVMTREASADAAQAVLRRVVDLVEGVGGIVDTVEEDYSAMALRSRQTGGTGAGDEAVLNAARRNNAVVLTADGNFGDNAARQGVPAFSPRALADVFVAV